MDLYFVFQDIISIAFIHRVDLVFLPSLGWSMVFLHFTTCSAASFTEVKSLAKGLGDLSLLLHRVLHGIKGMDQWRNGTNEPLQREFQRVVSRHRQHMLSAGVIATLQSGCF